MKMNRKFFKTKEKAEGFAKTVNGEVYHKNDDLYKLEARTLLHAEDYFEQFDYCVFWMESEDSTQ